MLYDGIIESLVKAQGHIERKEWRESGHQFARAFTIIAGLRETIDFDRGQPVADDLFRFYNALTAQLIKAQSRRDLELLKACIDMVTDVRGSWSQLALQGASGPAVTVNPAESSRTATAPIGAAVAAAF
jgi:flagellar biosynthetic protein FliS